MPASNPRNRYECTTSGFGSTQEPTLCFEVFATLVSRTTWTTRWSLLRSHTLAAGYKTCGTPRLRREHTTRPSRDMTAPATAARTNASTMLPRCYTRPPPGARDWLRLQRQTPPRPNGAHGTPEERRGTEQECGQHPWWVLFCDGGTAGTASQGTAARAALIRLRACVSAVFLSTKHIASGQWSPGVTSPRRSRKMRPRSVEPKVLSADDAPRRGR